MKDEMFGELIYDYLWEGRVTINLYGEKYEIDLGIEGEEEEGISELQKEAYMMYKKKESEISLKIEKAIYEYYCSICDYEREKNDVEIFKKVPNITNHLEMKNLVKPIKLCIPELDDEREIDLLFDCTWDIELGMGVSIVNEEINIIGVQNDVL